MNSTFFTLALLFLILVNVHTGIVNLPLCLAACTPLIPPSIAYRTCVAKCQSSTSWLCFDDTATMVTQQGILSVELLSPQMKVLTSLNGKSQWTTVLKLVKTSAPYDFIQISTQNKTLTVTLNHLMVVGSKLVKAENLKIGMQLGKQTIQKLELIHKKDKYTVVTADGTLLANGILTTTLCGEYEGMEVKEGLKKWKKDHEWLIEPQQE